MNTKAKRSKQHPLDKHEVDTYFKNLERCFSLLNTEDQRKMEFADYFLSKLTLYNLDGASIQIAEIDTRTLKFFLYSVVLDYEMWLSKQEDEHKLTLLNTNQNKT
jgi:hypothetical protein